MTAASPWWMPDIHADRRPRLMARCVGAERLGGEGGKVCLVARRNLQRRGRHLDEITFREPAAKRRRDGVARHK
ncbi:MAG: hypothetical protein E5W35_22985, partial [Mesorhizobium sp.]